MENDQKLLDVTETAELCHLKVSTIRRWVLGRRLPYVKLGRRVLFRRSDIETLIERNVVPAREPKKMGRRVLFERRGLEGCSRRAHIGQSAKSSRKA